MSKLLDRPIVNLQWDEHRGHTRVQTSLIPSNNNQGPSDSGGKHVVIILGLYRTVNYIELDERVCIYISIKNI